MPEPTTFRQERRRIDPSEVTPNVPQHNLADVHAFQRAAGVNVPEEQQSPVPNPAAQPQFKGNVPPQFQQLQQRMQETTPMPLPPQMPSARQESIGMTNSGNTALDALLAGINGLHNYEPVSLPSGGKFYHAANLPTDGLIHLRPMTGKEEQFLATDRFARGNTATNMILKSCIKEDIDVNKLLLEDRTYLLIYLRGISYGNIYDVNIKCGVCGNSFEYPIDLKSLPVNKCDESFQPEQLTETLPVSNYRFCYRFPSGDDEADVIEYRKRRTRHNPDALDDTFFYRASMLLDYISNGDFNVTDKAQIRALLPQMPVADINFLRNVLNETPFGVDIEMMLACPSCYGEFKTSIPMELSFFFPRNKKETLL